MKRNPVPRGEEAAEEYRARCEKAYDRVSRRNVYARRRALRMSPAEAKYETRERHRQRCWEYRQQWGGDPKLGSQAWVRREITRTKWA